jgi:phospholipase/lecithinase/hemolysin
MKANSSNSEYRNFYVLGDSLSDSGAFIEILKYLSFAQYIKIDEPFYKGRIFSNGPVAC